MAAARKKKSAHGGRREGAGRKVETPGDPVKKVGYSLRTSTVDRLEEHAADAPSRSKLVDQLLNEAMDARDKKAARAKARKSK